MKQMTGYQDAYGQQPGRPRLASVMREVSYACSLDNATFRGVLQSVDARVDEQTVAEVLAMMAHTCPVAFPGVSPASLQPDQLAALNATLAAIANGGLSPTPGAPVLGDGSNSGVVGWAWKVVMDVLKSVNPSLNWQKVAELLDQPSFMLQSQEGFWLLAHAYRYVAGEQLPVRAVAGRRWNNEMGQLSLLKFAVMAPPEVFSFAASERKVPPVEGLQGGKSPVGTPNQAWLSVDLLQIMCHFTVDAAKRPTVLAMLEYPIKSCPEVLLLAMAAVPEDTPILQREVYSILLPPYLKDTHPNAQLVLERLWRINPKLVKEMLLEYYLHDRQEHLPRTHDICQELKVLPEVLSDTPSCRFALHLAVYASQVKQTINLEQWASSRLKREPVTMVYEVMLFLYAKTLAAADPTQQSRVLGRLSDDTVHTLLRLLLPLRAQLAADFTDAYSQMAEVLSKAYPTLQASLQGPLFTADVEADAKGTLQRLYSRTANWEEVFNHEQKLRASPNQRDQDLYACFVYQVLNELPHHLFDEFKDMQSVCMLVSAMIAQQVLPPLALGMALRLVLFALRQQPSTRAFTFGITMLRVMAPRLQRTFSAFCEQVLLTAHVRDADPELFARVDAAFREFQHSLHAGETIQPLYAMLPILNLPAEAGQANLAALQMGSHPVASPSKAPTPVQRPVGPGGQGASAAVQAWLQQPAQNQAMQGVPEYDKNKSVEGNDIASELENNLLGAAQQAPPAQTKITNVNTVSLENATEKHQSPPEGITDSVHFTINNLTMDNLEKKAEDIKSKVCPDYRGWFCEYMAKRAAQEHNHQGMYLRLVDKMNDAALTKQLIRSSYFYVRLLLTGDRAVRESNDRQLLKNLGHWLGNLTLKKNKPLLSKELELKEIVIEAYQRGRLVSVLPFVANLLSCCEKSQVFTPNNPMISGLLSLLAELHKLPHLKFNGQYCIEMVFKTFGNPTVEPTNILANLTRDTLNNADFSAVAEDNVDRNLSAEATSNMQAMMNMNVAAVKAFSQNIMGQRTPTKPPGMGNGNVPAAAAQAPGQPQPMGAGQSGVPNAPALVAGLLHGDVSKETSGGVRPGPAAPAAAGAAQPAGQPAVPGAPPVPQPSGLSIEHNAMIQYLSQNAHINPSLGAIAERLQLKRHVPTAIERAIWEILNPVVERSVTIACSTTLELLSKDFALDGDEIRMRKAAHLMVSSLAGSLALVTCKDPLRIALTNQLSQLLAGQAVSGIEKSMLEQVVTVVVQDNLEACCSVFERAATDKAVRDADKQLQEKYDERINAKKMGRPFQGDQAAFHGRFPQLPESLRPRPGVVSAMQLRVYEDFARIPRAPPPVQPGPLPGMRPYGTGEDGMPKEAGGMGTAAGMQGGMLEAQYGQWQNNVDAALAKAEAGGGEQDLQAAMQEVVEMCQGPNSDEMCQFFLTQIFRHLFQLPTGPTKLAGSFFTAAMRQLGEALSSRGTPSVNLTAAWIGTEDERKFSKEAVEVLLHAGLLNPVELDTALARAVGRSPAAGDLVAHLIKTLIVKEHALSHADLASSIEALGKMAAQMRANATPSQVNSAEQQLALVEQARRASPPALQPQRSPQEFPACLREKNDGVVKDQAYVMFDDWVKLCNSSTGFTLAACNPHAANATEADRAALMAYLASLRASGFLKDEASSERWVRLIIELVLTHSTSLAEQARGVEGPHIYIAVDALARLLTCITVHTGGLPFLRAALAVIVGVIKRDADDRSVAFNGRPYMRLIVGLMAELPGGNTANSSSPEALDPTALKYLRAIAEALHALQPLSVPGWAFCWLTAVAHRSLMPRLLLSPSQHGWVVYEHLLVDLLKFLDPYLRSSGEMTECVRALYKGTLRLLLVLLHDFPEFLCEHYFLLCDAIPVSCVQLRNLVLSAFPRNMRLPDPFTPGLKVDLLPEIMQPPRVLPEPERLLDQDEQLKQSIDSYLHTRTPAALPTDLARAFKLAQASADGKNYNVSLINAVVLYVGATSRSSTTPADGPAMDIFLRLMETLDSEGRYLVLNAAANQLRYPNSHTYYFSCMLLTLFAEVKGEGVKEQITRVLLERLVVNRPHPWGLLITFIELIKNQRYQFWAHDFTRNGNDVERLFKNVAASCMAHGAPQNAAQQPLQQAAAAAGADGKDNDDAVAGAGAAART